MMESLRRRFVAAAMLSLACVLLLLMGSVNALNGLRMVRNLDSTLALLQENDGRFPEGPMPRGEDGRRGREDFSLELPFQARFFTVTLDETGAYLASDLDRIAAEDASTAQALGETAWKRGRKKGFLSHYRYVRCDWADGEVTGTRFIFLNCETERGAVRSFLLLSVLMSLAGMAGVFALLMPLSRRIVRPMAESYEKQKRFTTDAGHELKTPISIILADTEVLELDNPDNEFLQDIRTQAGRLTGLTQDLIYLSRMDEQTGAPLATDFNFSELVQETAKGFSSLALTQNKTFTVKTEPLLSVHGDEKSLEKLVSILLDNALKYSPAGGVIRLNLARDGKNLKLSVYNSAEKMEKGSQDKLFDRFYRGDPSRSTSGYGLGLSIAKAIVGAHKGRITAYSLDGVSLTVELTLPALGSKEREA